MVTFTFSPVDNDGCHSNLIKNTGLPDETITLTTNNSYNISQLEDFLNRALDDYMCLYDSVFGGRLRLVLSDPHDGPRDVYTSDHLFNYTAPLFSDNLPVPLIVHKFDAKSDFKLIGVSISLYAQQVLATNGVDAKTLFVLTSDSNLNGYIRTKSSIVKYMSPFLPGDIAVIVDAAPSGVRVVLEHIDSSKHVLQLVKPKDYSTSAFVRMFSGHGLGLEGFCVLLDITQDNGLWHSVHEALDPVIASVNLVAAEAGCYFVVSDISRKDNHISYAISMVCTNYGPVPYTIHNASINVIKGTNINSMAVTSCQRITPHAISIPSNLRQDISVMITSRHDSLFKVLSELSLLLITQFTDENKSGYLKTMTIEPLHKTPKDFREPFYNRQYGSFFRYVIKVFDVTYRSHMLGYAYPLLTDLGGLFGMVDVKTGYSTIDLDNTHLIQVTKSIVVRHSDSFTQYLKTLSPLLSNTVLSIDVAYGTTNTTPTYSAVGRYIVARYTSARDIFSLPYIILVDSPEDNIIINLVLTYFNDVPQDNAGILVVCKSTMYVSNLFRVLTQRNYLDAYHAVSVLGMTSGLQQVSTLVDDNGAVYYSLSNIPFGKPSRDIINTYDMDDITSYVDKTLQVTERRKEKDIGHDTEALSTFLLEGSGWIDLLDIPDYDERTSYTDFHNLVNGSADSSSLTKIKETIMDLAKSDSVEKLKSKFKVYLNKLKDATVRFQGITSSNEVTCMFICEESSFDYDSTVFKTVDMIPVPRVKGWQLQGLLKSKNAMLDAISRLYYTKPLNDTQVTYTLSIRDVKKDEKERVRVPVDNYLTQSIHDIYKSLSFKHPFSDRVLYINYTIDSSYNFSSVQRIGYALTNRVKNFVS